MAFLIRQTLIYAIPLMIVALAGIFAERSGIINLALEGIMIFGAFAGVLFVRLMQQLGWFDAARAMDSWIALQGYLLLTMVMAAALGAVFSLLLSFAAINLRRRWCFSSCGCWPTRTPCCSSAGTAPPGS